MPRRIPERSPRARCPGASRAPATHSRPARPVAPCLPRPLTSRVPPDTTARSSRARPQRTPRAVRPHRDSRPHQRSSPPPIAWAPCAATPRTPDWHTAAHTRSHRTRAPCPHRALPADMLIPRPVAPHPRAARPHRDSRPHQRSFPPPIACRTLRHPRTLRYQSGRPRARPHSEHGLVPARARAIRPVSLASPRHGVKVGQAGFRAV